MNKRARNASIRQLERQRDKLEQSIENLNDVLDRLYLEKAQAESEIRVGDIVECKSLRLGKGVLATRYRVTEIYVRYQEPAYKGRQFLANGKLSDKVVDLKWKNPQPIKKRRS